MTMCAWNSCINVCVCVCVFVGWFLRVCVCVCGDCF